MDNEYNYYKPENNNEDGHGENMGGEVNFVLQPTPEKKEEHKKGDGNTQKQVRIFLFFLHVSHPLISSYGFSDRFCHTAYPPKS